MSMDYEIEEWLHRVSNEMLPSSRERQLASEAHKELRGLLQTGEMERRIARSYLSGSYVRRTAIQPLNDVDIVFEINPERWRSSGWFADEFPMPEKVIETFARAIKARVQDQARVRKQRCSVGVSTDSVHIDVVPAIPVFNDEEEEDCDEDEIDDDDAEDEEEEHWEEITFSDRVRIPDRDDDKWVESNPRGHVRLAAAINKDSGGLFKPTVRLLKTWNAQNAFGSFAVETIAGHVFRNYTVDSLLDGLDTVWDFVAARGGLQSDYDGDAFGVDLDGFLTAATIPDLAATGANVGAKYDSDDTRTFTTAALEAREQLRAARVSRKNATLDLKLSRLFRVR